VNFADGAGGGSHFRFIGNEGVITIDGNSAKLSRLAPQSEPGYSIGTFSEAMQKQAIEDYHKQYPEPERASLRGFTEEVFEAPGGYNDRLDHFTNFFTAMREDGSVVENGTYGFRAAAPALLTNMSYESREIVEWDPVGLKLKTSM
jgi:hypothetical protein